MYLSRVQLDPGMRATMRALQAPQMLHGAVERCFAGERRRRLWRIDWLADACFLLVLSEDVPDFAGLIDQFSSAALAGRGESKDYEPFLSRLRAGQAWRFRLKANPVIASRTGLEGTRLRGRIHAHVTPEQQKQWLMDRAAQHGFILDQQAFDVIHSQWQRFTKSDGARIPAFSDAGRQPAGGGRGPAPQGADRRPWQGQGIRPWPAHPGTMSELPGLKKPAIASLPRVRERMTFIYLEHCEISRQDSAITAMDARGTVHIPAASLAVLMLGPGTSVSHRAMELIGDNGACVIWVGEHGVRYYAHGRPLTRSAGLLSRQAALVSNARSRVAVARQMYLMRFPDEDIRRMSMQQLRGREGARVRQAYRQASLDSGIPWAGRAYDPQDFAGGSPINQALSAAHACLYGVSHSVIAALGCSPGLGFIHTGHERSFVYDIADLYKAQVTIPIAFQVVSRGEEDIAARTRRAVRDAMWEQRVIERAVRDINTLLQGEEQAAQEPEAEVLYLWDDREGVLAAGRSYAHSPPSSADSGADSPLDWHARRDAAGNPPG